MDSLKKTICMNIIKYLELSDIKSKKDLANLLGINRSSVTSWSKYESAPSLDLIPAICMHLGITINELCSMPSKDISELEYELITAFRSVSERKQKNVIELLKE